MPTTLTLAALAVLATVVILRQRLRTPAARPPQATELPPGIARLVLPRVTTTPRGEAADAAALAALRRDPRASALMIANALRHLGHEQPALQRGLVEAAIVLADSAALPALADIARRTPTPREDLDTVALRMTAMRGVESFARLGEPVALEVLLTLVDAADPAVARATTLALTQGDFGTDRLGRPLSRRRD